MSEHASPSAATDRPVTLETGLEAFQSSPEFSGPVEDLDGHDCNDHFAQIYETATEKFEAAVPFVRHGLARGEQIAYVVDQSTEAEVRTALQDAGIDVEAALDSAALTFYTVDETYLRNGSFDPDEMIQFYADATAEATEEFEALRLVAEMSWIEADDTTVEQLMEYESKINDLFDREDVLAICQYDRDLFAPEVINNIVRTHPHLIYDGAACHNFYYTPPEELFGDDDLARENERMLRTLRERTEAKTQLQHRDRFLQDLYTITADQTKSFEEKIHALLDLGCEHFGLDIGGLNRVDPDADYFVVEYLNGDHDVFEPGAEFSLSETYCQAAADIEEAATVVAPSVEGFDDVPVFEEYGIGGYIGTYIPVNGGMDRTLGFLPAESESVSVSEEDRTFLELMGQWVGYELERRQRERFLRESHEITADPDLGFERKLEQLLDLGRDWMDVSVAGLTHLPAEDGPFLNEYAIGYDGTDGGVVTATDDMWTDPGDGSYCRQALESDDPVGMADVRGTDWEDDPIHQHHGLSCYLGTKVTDGAMPYGTLWVGDTEPRDREFSETERTFLDLMARWVSYELERREHNNAQRELYEITADTALDTDEKITRLLEVGCDYLDLSIGMLNRDREDTIRVKQMHGDHPDVDTDSVLPPSSEHYCRQTIDTEAPVTVADAGTAGWDNDPFYEEVGLETYAGVPIIVGDEVHGTICFTDLSPRDGAFTDAEQTFLELMGQCVSYELDRTRREEQLEQKNDRLESFASMLAHELRNPVAIGQIYSQRLPAETDAEAVEYVTEAFDRIENMVDVMLVLTRGEEVVDEYTPIDLTAAVQDVWADVDAPDAVLEVTADQTIHADETYVRHLFRNLLENAVEHGGPAVTVEVGDLDDADGFYVADDGPGIPPEERDVIFDEGYTTTADRGGTGLGLAFVQKLTEVYEWDCCVTESAAGGARFEFRSVT